MKFNKIIAAFGLTMALLVQSCSDVIDVEPEFSKDGSQIFNTLNDYQFALTGAYALFRQVGYFGSGGQTTSTWANLPDMMTDNLVRTGEDLANWQTQVNWIYTTAESDVEIAWISAYSVVAQANLVLRGIEKFSATDAARVNRIRGQALAIRGMAHFDLLRFWGEEYDRNSTKWGVPYVTEVNIEAKPARLTVKQSWDKIFEDMLAAETALASVTGINSSSDRSFIDVTVVRALLARMYLYAKDYPKAESYASLVITAMPLASKTNFPNIWKDASVAEVIWSVAFNPGEGSPSTGLHNASANRNRFRPQIQLEATYDQVNDIRFSSYFASRTLGAASRRIVTKFFSRTTTPDNLVNWKAIRTGEMYLIRAEARALQTPAKTADAMADLNTLRDARINNYVSENLTGSALIDAIALERRKELVGEGHRWFDLKRTTRTINRPDIISGVLTTASLAPAAREWTWPIPQAEVDANANIKGQQTTGY